MIDDEWATEQFLWNPVTSTTLAKDDDEVWDGLFGYTAPKPSLRTRFRVWRMNLLFRLLHPSIRTSRFGLWRIRYLNKKIKKFTENK